MTPLDTWNEVPLVGFKNEEVRKMIEDAPLFYLESVQGEKRVKRRRDASPSDALAPLNTLYLNSNPETFKYPKAFSFFR